MRRHGLSVSALYYWRQKLNAAAETAGPHDGEKFIALHVGDLTAGGGVYAVSLDSGVRLEMPTLSPRNGWRR